MQLNLELAPKNSKVVNIRLFQEARSRRRAAQSAEEGRVAEVGTSISTPPADLSERQVEHRTRMLRHLAGA